MSRAGSSFASSASLLVGLQLLSRLFTFALNQALLRFVSPQAFGTAAIQFELFLSTILFLSREGFRNALLRAWSHSNDESKKTISPTISNLTLLPIFLGFPLAVFVAYTYHVAASVITKDQPYFNEAVVIYTIAALIELSSEPLHIRTMGEMRTVIRVRAEGLAVISKSMVTFLVLFLDASHDHVRALLAFALGQVAYSLVVLASYRLQYGAVPFLLQSPTSIKDSQSKHGWKRYFDHYYLGLSLSMTAQSVVKHLLTEGDKFLVSRISPLQDQGGYAVASNYGSLVARILFQPIEEMTRVFVSKTLSPAATASGDAGSANRRRTAMARAANVLLSILAIQVAISLLLLSLAPPYMKILLRIILPPRYQSTSAPSLLSAWLWYIPVLSINGVLEAFMAGLSTPADLHRQSRWMIGFSAVFICTTGVFYSLGFQDTSLIYANIVNLGLRIAYAAIFVSNHYTALHAKDLFSWSMALPRPWTGVMATVVFIVSRYSAQVNHIDYIFGRDSSVRALLSHEVMVHICTGMGLAIVFLAVWWRERGRYVLKVF